MPEVSEYRLLEALHVLLWSGARQQQRRRKTASTNWVNHDNHHNGYALDVGGSGHWTRMQHESRHSWRSAAGEWRKKNKIKEHRERKIEWRMEQWLYNNANTNGEHSYTAMGGRVEKEGRKWKRETKSSKGQKKGSNRKEKKEKESTA